MGIRGYFSWALVALAACGGSPPKVEESAFSSARAFNPLETCKTTNFSRFARGAQCSGARLLFVSREPSPAELLERARLNLAGYGVEVDPHTLKVNGRDMNTLVYHMGDPAAPTVSAIITAFEVPGTTESIEVQCYAYGEGVDPKRCASLLDGFVAQGLLRGEWPGGLDEADSRDLVVMRVAGREVHLPSSCDELSPYEVDCKQGHVHLLEASEKESLARMREVSLQVTKHESLDREWIAPCLLEGMSAECTIRKYKLPFHDELWAFYATATVRNRPIMLTCDTRKSRVGTPPGPICGQFLLFEGSALEEPPREEEGSEPSPPTSRAP